MPKHLISDDAEFSGEWFLPQVENQPPIAGNLKWTSRRATLHLHDSFTKMEGAIFGGEATSYPVVHGQTTGAQLITLMNALSAGRSINFGAHGLRQAERLVSSVVFIGAHVLPDTLFSEVRVRIPGLQMWIGSSGVSQTILPKAENSNAGVVYHIEGLKEEITEVPCLPATLGWGVDRDFSGDLVSEILVKSSACLRVSSPEPRSFEWYLEQVGKAATLLSFLAGTPMSPDHISAKLSGNNIEIEALVALREAKYCLHKNAHAFYMLRSSMEADIGKVFARWFELYEKVGMASQLAQSVLNSRGLWLHVEFLSLMQALEGLHRATMPGLYLSEQDYEPVREALSNAIPAHVLADQRESLKSRIKYGNEVSLRKRLDALVSTLPLSLRTQILGQDGTVPRSWIETRNYYTHWDESSRSLALGASEMHRAGVRMRHLLRALYLNLVGIPDAAIDKSLKNACDESQYLIQLNNMEYRKKGPDDKDALPKISR